MKKMKKHTHLYLSLGRTEKNANTDVGGCIKCHERKTIPAFHSNRGDFGCYIESLGRYENEIECETRHKQEKCIHSFRDGEGWRYSCYHCGIKYNNN